MVQQKERLLVRVSYSKNQTSIGSEELGLVSEQDFFKGESCLNNLIGRNIEMFEEILAKPLLFSLVECRELARERFLITEKIEEFVDICYDNINIKPLDVADLVESIFYQRIEDPILGHFLKCTQYFNGKIERVEACLTLENSIRELKGSDASHLILQMEV